LIVQVHDSQKPAQRELRTLFGAEIKHSFGKKIEFNQRNLLDFRLTRSIGTKEYSEKNRIRARFGLKYALSPKLGLTVANEYFLIFGNDIIAKNHFDQNRIIGGINYKFSPNFKMDISYMFVHQKRKNIDVFDEINSLFINVNYLFELDKKNE
jgi:long-subunit fatty acid transport protein